MVCKEATLVAGLNFGDEGKGAIVDFLARDESVGTVVRYNGGGQAAHNVVTPDGRHHTFAQFGSASFIPNVKTYLSSGMMVNPLSLLKEEEHLRSLGVFNLLTRTYIDESALITTPFHQAANRLREMARGGNRHGSCGMGIGETMSDYLKFGKDVLFAGDFTDTRLMKKKLEFVANQKRKEILDSIILPDSDEARQEMKILTDSGMIDACQEVYSYLARQINLVDASFLQNLLSRGEKVVFEGAQGVLLDEWFGFHPYTTWSTITYENADNLLDKSSFGGQRKRLGILRAYMTRHGAGPFVTEDEGLTRLIPDYHNGKNPWQRDFRVGYFDLVATKYALEVVGGVDGLAITCLDRMSTLPEWKVCTAYRPKGIAIDSDLFVSANGLITKIKVGRKDELDRQEKITQTLQQCEPVYETFQGRNPNLYASYLSEKLGVPLRITSSGLSSLEKSK